MRVALIQNRLQKGGRFRVMAEMIMIFNEHQIIPDLLCFRSSIDQEQAIDFFGSKLQFNIRKIGFEPPMPFEWNIVWFNLSVSKYLKSYDLVVNHNNTSFGLLGHGRSINYIHFPRKARLETGLDDMHQPEKGRTSAVNLSKDLFNLMRWCYRFNKTLGQNEKILANSEYTKQAILNSYSRLQDSHVEVLYPPVSTQNVEKKLGNKHKLVSLGRIARSKRQLEQIEIAQNLPHLELTIVGFVSDPEYLEECMNYIKINKIRNVKVLVDAPKTTVNSSLAEAAFFIHSMRNEPFGITSVQAIVSGCLPIVHNSGGQKEVVSDDYLRYDTISDAVEKLRELTQLENGILENKLEALQQHVKAYDVTVFRNRFEKILLNLPK